MFYTRHMKLYQFQLDRFIYLDISQPLKVSGYLIQTDDRKNILEDTRFQKKFIYHPAAPRAASMDMCSDEFIVDLLITTSPTSSDTNTMIKSYLIFNH